METSRERLYNVLSLRFGKVNIFILQSYSFTQFIFLISDPYSALAVQDKFSISVYLLASLEIRRLAQSLKNHD